MKVYLLILIALLSGCTFETSTSCPNPEQGGAGGEAEEQVSSSSSTSVVSSTSSLSQQDACDSLSAFAGRPACHDHGPLDCGTCEARGAICGGFDIDPITLLPTDSIPGFCGGACVPFTPDLVGGNPEPHCPPNLYPFACGSALAAPDCQKEFYAPLDGFFFCCPAAE